MIRILFGRISVAGLIVALAVVGCGQAETDPPGALGPAPTGGLTTTPYPSGANPSGSNPDGSNPDGSNPGGSNPDGSNPGGSNPDGSNPGGSNPDGSNPGGSNPDGSNPGGSNPGGSNPGGSNPGGSNPGGSNPSGSNPSGSNPTPREIAWVPPGPGRDDPIYQTDVPPEMQWHHAFDHRDCDGIAALGPKRGQVPLYAGLGDACRAILEHDDQQWPAVEVAWQRVSRPSGCLDGLAFRLLRDLVMAHRQAPDTAIRIVDAPHGERCDADDPTSSPPHVP